MCHLESYLLLFMVFPLAQVKQIFTLLWIPRWILWTTLNSLILSYMFSKLIARIQKSFFDISTSLKLHDWYFSYIAKCNKYVVNQSLCDPSVNSWPNYFIIITIQHSSDLCGQSNAHVLSFYLSLINDFQNITIGTCITLQKDQGLLMKSLA